MLPGQESAGGNNVDINALLEQAQEAAEVRNVRGSSAVFHHKFHIFLAVLT